jgi:hypothetical protein
MFAKPHWFRMKSIEHGIAPASFGGWLYVAGAVAIGLVPTLLLLARGQWVEGLIWILAVTAFATFDLWQVRRALCGVRCSLKTLATPSETTPTTTQPPSADDGIYFLDQRSGAQPVNTTRFQLSLKQ